MKDYLKAVNGLQRVCDLVDKGASFEPSTVDYYIESFITQFEATFGGISDATAKLATFRKARMALKQQDLHNAVELIRSADVFIE